MSDRSTAGEREKAAERRTDGWTERSRRIDRQGEVRRQEDRMMDM